MRQRILFDLINTELHKPNTEYKPTKLNYCTS